MYSIFIWHIYTFWQRKMLDTFIINADSIDNLGFIKHKTGYKKLTAFK